MTEVCPRCGFGTVEGAACPRCGVNVAQYRAALSVASAPAPPRGHPEPAGAEPEAAGPRPAAEPPAGFWIRVGAFVIDGVLLGPVHVLAPPVGWLIGPMYWVTFHWLWGQTLGKMAMKIRVVTVDGGPLSLGIVVLRYIGYLLSALTLGVGYLMVAFRADRRGLHDLVAGTRVVRINAVATLTSRT